MFTYITYILFALAVIGAALNIMKQRVGFLLWIVSDVGWIIINLRYGIWAQALQFLVFTGLAAYGFAQWTIENDSKKDRCKLLQEENNYLKYALSQHRDLA